MLSGGENAAFYEVEINKFIGGKRLGSIILSQPAGRSGKLLRIYVGIIHKARSIVITFKRLYL